MHLHGTAALVTGGGGLLGRTTAQTLAARGAHVVVVDRRPPPAGQADRGITHVTADVCDADAVVAAVATATDHGPLRVVVNTAGTWHMQRLLGRDGSTFPIERLREALEVNVVGTFMVMCHAAQSMARQPPVDGDGQRGVVINVASLAGLEGSVGQTAYGAAKAAVVGMTLPAARDLGPVGIRVVTIAPGGITPNGQADESEPVEARLLEQTPFPRRFGTPEEFSDMVAAIIDNAYINATTLRLDGGLRLPRR